METKSNRLQLPAVQATIITKVLLKGNSADATGD